MKRKKSKQGSEGYFFAEYTVVNLQSKKRYEGLSLCPRRFEAAIMDYVPDELTLISLIEKRLGDKDPEFFEGTLAFDDIKCTYIPDSFCLLKNMN